LSFRFWVVCSNYCSGICSGFGDLSKNIAIQKSSKLLLHATIGILLQCNKLVAKLFRFTTSKPPQK